MSKLLISLAAHTAFYVPNAGEIVTFNPPVRYACLQIGSLGLIPHQSASGTSAEVTFLRQLKILGWDYQPESLSDITIANIKVFASSHSQYPKQIVDAIEAAGFKVIHLDLSLKQFEELVEVHKNPPKPLPRYETVEETSSKHLYARTRFLWKNHHTQFTDWEFKFVKSVGAQLNTSKPLTVAQQIQLDRIMAKYTVPLNAQAGSYGDDDLTTLKSSHISRLNSDFDSAEHTHYQCARHTNELGQSIKRTTISKRKKAAAMKALADKKHQKKLKLALEAKRSADTNPAVTDKSVSSAAPTRITISLSVATASKKKPLSPAVKKEKEIQLKAKKAELLEHAESLEGLQSDFNKAKGEKKVELAKRIDAKRKKMAAIKIAISVLSIAVQVGVALLTHRLTSVPRIH